MNRYSLPRPSILAAGLALGVLLQPTAFGQIAPAPDKVPPPAARTTPAPAVDKEMVELSPFVVEAPRDDSYGVLNSNSITSFNTELEKLPISADVLTSAFMDDTNSTTLENMLRSYSAGAGTGSAAGDVGGIPVNQPMDRGGGDSVSAGVQLRGLGAAVVKQDGFMLPSPAGTGLNSNFGTERVEVINGPQALLYGNGGGGGVVNIISKQARFGQKPTGSLKLQMDQYGHELAQLDYSVGNSRAAVAISLLHQNLGDNRDFIGGPLQGVYAQFAFKLTKNTTLRLTGKQTELDRFTQQGLTLNATSTAVDARHGQNIRYLLATNQLAASASGPSGAGVIGNGRVTWDNVDSYGGNLRQELTTARLISLGAETRWSSWLTTQLSVGYQDKESELGYGSGVAFYAPVATANPIPGEWSIAAGGTTGNAAAVQPSDSRSARFSALFTNDIFGGRGQSQTIIGAEYTVGNYANEAFAYYEADASFNPILTPTGARIRLNAPNPFFSVQNGPVKNPWFDVGTKQISYLGKNYVRQVQNLTNPALISPNNPQGVTSTDLFIHSRAISGGVFAVNYTQWMDGRLTTLAGARFVTAENRQFASSAIPAIKASGENVSFSVGANFALNSWLRPYFALSDTYNLPGVLLTVPADPYGNPAPISHSLGQEIGVKIGSGSISGSVALYAVQSTDEPYAIPTQLRDSINPAGLNGRHLGATGSVITVDRQSAGLQAALTAAPSRNWRMRLSAAVIKGTIDTNTRYAPLYNDQIYANPQGQVTYANGTVVYVRPAVLTTPGTAANAGYIPLTIAMLSTPGDAYYANPGPITGQLGTSNGRTLLNNTAAASVIANGSIRTGVTGLPISSLQITGVTPPNTIVTSRAGDRTTGYPEFSLNYTNMYTVSAGTLKGFRLGGTANLAWRRGDYYYYPTGYTPTASRELFSRPTTVLFDVIVGYQRKFKTVTWSAQMNVNNVFDNYEIVIRPNNISGFSGIKNALYSNQPREFTFSTTFKF